MPGDSTRDGRYTASGGPQVGSPGSVGGTHGAVATTSTVDDPGALSRGPQDGTGTAGDGSAVLGPDGNPIDVNTGLAGDGTLAGAGALGLGGLTTSLLAAGSAGGPLGGVFHLPGNEINGVGGRVGLAPQIFCPGGAR